MPLGLGLGITKLKSLISGLRVRFQGNATITAALDGILRDLSADFVSNGTVTAALEAIKLLDVDFSGDGIVTADLASFEGLLDLYPNAAAAYSIRLLSSTYSGALVEIRRSSDNALKSFYPDSNNELSLSSEDGASTSLSSWIGSDNGFVRTWFDQSGNSRNGTQTSSSNQPQLISLGSLITDNGKPALQFISANNNYLTTTLGFAGDYTTFNTLNINSGGSFPIAIGSTVANNYLLINQSSSNYWYQFYGSVIPLRGANDSINYNTQRLITISKLPSSTSAYIYDNNAPIDITSSTSIDGSGNIVIGAETSGSFPFTGEMQEIVIFSGNKSSDRVGVQNNINDYFSIY